MSSKRNEIKKLPRSVRNQISAGEVVKRPASVVKELIENSIDAGADKINVEITEGGRKKIVVRDNGIGIPSDKIEEAFERYTTSKIREIDDIHSLETLGFRGEALASIASVSRLKIKSRYQSEKKGTIIKFAGGEKKERKTAGLPVGTEIEVRDLFFNTPARFKHLKKSATEAKHVSRRITAEALAYPEINFSYKSDGSERMKTPGDGNLKSVIFHLFGEEIYSELIKVNSSSKILELRGFIAGPEVTRSSRRYEFFFINRRPAANENLRKGVESGYSEYLDKGEYPLVFLNININPILTDFNVHPNKKKIKFSRGQEIREIIAGEIEKALKKYEGTKADINQKRKNFDQKSIKKTGRKGESSAEEYHRDRFDFSSGNIKMSDKREDYKKDNKAEFSFPDSSLNPDNKTDFESKPPTKVDNLSRGVIGQLHNLFILYQSRDGLLIIDQHNAHERIIYDKLKSRIDSGKIESEMLITPINLTLSPDEKERLLEISDYLNELGFSIDNFGPDSYAITAVPLFIKNNEDSDPKETLRRVLEADIKLAPSDIQKELLKYTCCRQAVKEGVSLNIEEMKRICRKLFETSNPHLCPHKRPIIINYSLDHLKEEVERP